VNRQTRWITRGVTFPAVTVEIFAVIPPTALRHQLGSPYCRGLASSLLPSPPRSSPTSCVLYSTPEGVSNIIDELMSEDFHVRTERSALSGVSLVDSITVTQPLWLNYNIRNVLLRCIRASRRSLHEESFERGLEQSQTISAVRGRRAETTGQIPSPRSWPLHQCEKSVGVGG
jgi:hypothetical protein